MEHIHVYEKSSIKDSQWYDIYKGMEHIHVYEKRTYRFVNDVEKTKNKRFFTRRSFWKRIVFFDLAIVLKNWTFSNNSVILYLSLFLIYLYVLLIYLYSWFISTPDLSLCNLDLSLFLMYLYVFLIYLYSWFISMYSWFISMYS